MVAKLFFVFLIFGTGWTTENIWTPKTYRFTVVIISYSVFHATLGTLHSVFLNLLAY